LLQVEEWAPEVREVLQAEEQKARAWHGRTALFQALANQKLGNKKKPKRCLKN
jgi:hypothetical protein